MFKDDIRVDESAAEPQGIDRRTIAKGVAWTVPVVIVATAAPAAASSHDLGAIAVGGTRGGTPQNRNVTITVSLAAGTGTREVRIESLPGAGITSMLPTPAVRATGTSAVFILNRSNNGAGPYTVSVSVDGHAATFTGITFS